MSTLVNAKGQVVIEKAIRDALSVKPGWIAVQRLVGERVEITFQRPEQGPKDDRSLRGILSAANDQSVPAEKWPQAKELAWRAAVSELASEQEQVERG